MCRARSREGGQGAGEGPRLACPRRGKAYPVRQSEAGAGARTSPQESSLRPRRKKNLSNLNSGPASRWAEPIECRPIHTQEKKGLGSSQ